MPDPTEEVVVKASPGLSSDYFFFFALPRGITYHYTSLVLLMTGVFNRLGYEHVRDEQTSFFLVQRKRLIRMM